MNPRVSFSIDVFALRVKDREPPVISQRAAGQHASRIDLDGTQRLHGINEDAREIGHFRFPAESFIN